MKASGIKSMVFAGAFLLGMNAFAQNGVGVGDGDTGEYGTQVTYFKSMLPSCEVAQNPFDPLGWVNSIETVIRSASFMANVNNALSPETGYLSFKAAFEAVARSLESCKDLKSTITRPAINLIVKQVDILEKGLRVDTIPQRSQILFKFSQDAANVILSASRKIDAKYMLPFISYWNPATGFYIPCDPNAPIGSCQYNYTCRIPQFDVIGFQRVILNIVADQLILTNALLVPGTSIPLGGAETIYFKLTQSAVLDAIQTIKSNLLIYDSIVPYTLLTVTQRKIEFLLPMVDVTSPQNHIAFGLYEISNDINKIANMLKSYF